MYQHPSYMFIVIFKKKQQDVSTQDIFLALSSTIGDQRVLVEW